jgi:hypothetical protein
VPCASVRECPLSIWHPLGVEDDWRLTGQEQLLQGASFQHKPYRAWREDWDHDHCVFCQRKLVEDVARFDDPDAVSVAYAAVGRGPNAEDDYYWVCGDCFSDFRARFDWRVVPAEG